MIVMKPDLRSSISGVEKIRESLILSTKFESLLSLSNLILAI